MNGPVRLNTRVSAELNEWLNKESAATGMSKSAIVANAVEMARLQKMSMQSLPQINDLLRLAEEQNRKSE